MIDYDADLADFELDIPEDYNVPSVIESHAEAFGDRVAVRFRDDEGYFFFEGRSDDIIISAGYRIGPFEVEDALVSHEAVAEAAVVDSPHDERGAVVKADVVLAGGHDPSDDLAEEVQDFVKTETAPYKYPRRIEFVDELPKTSSGKIRRIELRDREREKYAT